MSNYPLLPFAEPSHYVPTRFVLREMNCGYHDQYTRPMQTNGTSRVINELARGWDPSKGHRSFLNNANAFLAPQATPEGKAIIENGWGERRFMFYLELSEQGHGSTSTTFRYGVIGFTNHADLSFNNLFDPNSHMYFNTILKFQDCAYRKPNGEIGTMTKLLSSTSVVVNPTPLDPHLGLGAQSTTRYSTLRPSDIVSMMSAVDAFGIGNEQYNIINSANTVGRNRSVMLSDSSNGIASKYIGNLINSFNSAGLLMMTDSSYSGDIDDPGEQSKNAHAFLNNELGISNIGFIEKLMSHFAYGSRPFVKFQDLRSLFPGIDSDRVAEMSTLPPHQRYSNQYYNTESFAGSGPETSTAFTLSVSIPPLMMNAGLLEIGFTATNRTVDGSWVFNLAADPINGIYPTPISNTIDVQDLLTGFFNRVEVEIFRGLSHYGNVDMMLKVMCDMRGDFLIEISMSGGPMVAYACPAFCSSCYNPMMTMDSNRAVNIANDFIQLRNTCGVDIDSFKLRHTKTHFDASQLV